MNRAEFQAGLNRWVNEAETEDQLQCRSSAADQIQRAFDDGKETLYLSARRLTSIPAEIGELTSLRELDLSANSLPDLPASIGNLSNLEELHLTHNQLTSVPTTLGNLTNLRKLDLKSNALAYVPATLGNLKNLRTLELSENVLTDIPAALGNLTNLEELRLGENALTSVPGTLVSLKNLKELALYDNQLTSIPPGFGNLKKLEGLRLQNNKLTYLPTDLSNLGQLIWGIYIHNNPLSSIPPDLQFNLSESDAEWYRKVLQRNNEPKSISQNFTARLPGQLPASNKIPPSDARKQLPSTPFLESGNSMQGAPLGRVRALEEYSDNFNAAIYDGHIAAAAFHQQRGRPAATLSGGSSSARAAAFGGAVAYSIAGEFPGGHAIGGLAVAAASQIAQNQSSKIYKALESHLFFKLQWQLFQRFQCLAAAR